MSTTMDITIPFNVVDKDSITPYIHYVVLQLQEDIQAKLPDNVTFTQHHNWEEVHAFSKTAKELAQKLYNEGETGKNTILKLRISVPNPAKFINHKDGMGYIYHGMEWIRMRILLFLVKLHYRRLSSALKPAKIDRTKAIGLIEEIDKEVSAIWIEHQYTFYPLSDDAYKTLSFIKQVAGECAKHLTPFHNYAEFLESGIAPKLDMPISYTMFDAYEVSCHSMKYWILLRACLASFFCKMRGPMWDFISVQLINPAGGKFPLAKILFLAPNTADSFQNLIYSAQPWFHDWIEYCNTEERRQALTTNPLSYMDHLFAEFKSAEATSVAEEKSNNTVSSASVTANSKASSKSKLNIQAQSPVLPASSESVQSKLVDIKTKPSRGAKASVSKPEIQVVANISPDPSLSVVAIKKTQKAKNTNSKKKNSNEPKTTARIPADVSSEADSGSAESESESVVSDSDSGSTSGSEMQLTPEVTSDDESKKSASRGTKRSRIAKENSTSDSTTDSDGQQDSNNEALAEISKQEKSRNINLAKKKQK